MKRCNNCGWFNMDFAQCCEKCGDESFDLEEPVAEESKIKDIKSDEQKPDNPETNKVNADHSMMGTVAFGSGVRTQPVEKPAKKALAATVMDVSAVMDDQPKQCPKCCYPVSGYMDFCPNCGSTIRKTTVSQEVKSTLCEEVEETPAPAVNLKATVRDIPESLKVSMKDVYRLIPVDSVGSAPVEMSLGEEVVIQGCRYRFQK